jgi:hypothetical protein
MSREVNLACSQFRLFRLAFFVTSNEDKSLLPQYRDSSTVSIDTSSDVKGFAWHIKTRSFTFFEKTREERLLTLQFS